MCGICGDVRTPGGGKVDAAVVERMSLAQQHRGPDDQGVWVEEGIGLGHRRLSILDLSGGHQPMADPSNRVVVTYNGELYNYVELREALQAKGHRFAGSGDTEVLLHAYLEWGIEALARFSGMFAFGLYDRQQHWLFAARDPFGQKPFLYYADEAGIVFASELSSLLRHPRVPRELDREALARYLVYENFMAPDTPVRGVRKLPPGHALLYHRQTGQLKIWPYWDPIGAPPDQPARALTLADEEQFIECLRASVARHLRSDVPVGVYLSGGVDSTALTALSCDILGGQNLQTFTIGHTERSFDESAQARRFARQFGTQHHERILTPEQCVQTVPDCVRHLDEPLADPGYLSVCQAALLASDHVKVVLAGDGGDELLCGYETFKVWEASERLHRATSPAVRRLLRRVIDATPVQYGYMGLWYRARHFMRGLDAPAALRNSLWICAFTPAEAQALLRGGEQAQALQPGADGWARVFEPVRQMHERAAGFDALGRLGLEYQQMFLSNCICPHTDKANMRYSLEARSPFLDPAVVRYLNALPSEWKLHGWQAKWLLRRWLGRRLGRRLPVKKRGFASPIAIWLRRELRAFAWSYLNPEALEAVGVFEAAPTLVLWNEHQRGRANHAKKLWTLLVFQVWVYTHLMDRQPPQQQEPERTHSALNLEPRTSHV